MIFASRTFLLPAFVALLSALIFQGTRPLYDTSEGRYAECAREMLETGNFLEPQLDYQPHWTKPPLAYWAIAGGMAIAGENAWGARLPGAIAFAIAAGCVALAAATFWGAGAGLTAGFIYASGFLPVAGSHTVTTDIFLACFLSIVGLAFFQIVRSADEKNAAALTRWRLLLWLGLGLAFLTKGPPSLLILIPILVWNWRRGKGRRVKLASLASTAVFVVSGLGWYLWMVATHEGLLGYYLGTEIAARVASNDVHNSEWWKPFTLYFPVTLLTLGPWGIAALIGGWRGGFLRLKTLGQKLSVNTPSAFLLLWWALPFTVFCLSKSRLELYILPLAAPLAIAAGVVISRRWQARSFAITLIATIAFLSFAKIAFAAAPQRGNGLALKNEIDSAIASLPEKPEIVIFDEKLFSLQFYERRSIRRIEIERDLKWSDATLDEFLVAHRKNAFPAGAILICSNRRTSELENALTTRNAAFEKLPQVFATPESPLARALTPLFKPKDHWLLYRLAPPQS